jgi:uncharacterized membrane protein (UPF0127 family)
VRIRETVETRAFTLVRDDDGSVVCDSCRLAATFWARLRGLLGRGGLASGEGLLIRRTGSVHTFFMRFAIDAVFLDRSGAVVKLVSNLRPWRVALARGARDVLELGAGEAERRGIRRGDRLEPASEGARAA